jgi:hypothetical protein
MDASLIDRVLAERRAGDRAVLPTAAIDGTPAVRQQRWLRSLTAAAAAILLFVVAYRAWQSRAPQQRPSAPRASTGKLSPASTEELAVSEFFLPRSAFASEVARADSSFPPLALDGARLRPRVVEYARFERDASGARRRTGREILELSTARVEGRDAWRAVQRRQIADTEHVETAYVDRATLRLLGRTIRVQPYMHYPGITVRQRLMGDSLTGWMQTDSGLGRPIARHLSPRFEPYLSDALAPLLLGATGLGPAWRGRFSILGWAVRNGDVSFPAMLRVAGAERVTVPAGTFDCWKLSVDAGIGMQTYWVRKSDGVGVRALFESEGVVRELVLTR